VYQNDRLISEWNSLKSKAILKYLLAQPETPIVKDVLMDVFWPDADPEAARRNLHQAIYSLRQILKGIQPGFQHIQFENDCYRLNPELEIWLDVQEFEKHVQAGQRLEAVGRFDDAMVEYGIAEGLYQGDFLEEDLYEDWPSPVRHHIRNTYLVIADHLSDYYLQRREFTAAVALCQKVLAQDNCYETAHRRLMQCYLAQGQRHLAVRQFQACVQALNEQLDLTPAEETMALYQRIIAAI
jgi:DNA-binding SARP family transcriptional activator